MDIKEEKSRLLTGKESNISKQVKEKVETAKQYIECKK